MLGAFGERFGWSWGSKSPSILKSRHIREPTYFVGKTEVRVGEGIVTCNPATSKKCQKTVATARASLWATFDTSGPHFCVDFGDFLGHFGAFCPPKGDPGPFQNPPETLHRSGALFLAFQSDPGANPLGTPTPPGRIGGMSRARLEPL